MNWSIFSENNLKTNFEAKTYSNQYEILLTNWLRPYLFLILFVWLWINLSSSSEYFGIIKTCIYTFTKILPSPVGCYVYAVRSVPCISPIVLFLFPVFTFNSNFFFKILILPQFMLHDNNIGYPFWTFWRSFLLYSFIGR